MLDLPEPELHALDSGLLRVAPGLGHHRWGHVDTDDPAAWADSLRRQEAVEASAAAEVDDRLARPEAGNRLRVPAPKAEVCAGRHTRQILLRVASFKLEPGPPPQQPGAQPGASASATLP